MALRDDVAALLRRTRLHGEDKQADAIIPLVRAAERQRDAKDARIAELERALTYLANVADSAADTCSTSMMDDAITEAQAVLEGRQS
jgi:hypothetical protein